jgi:WD40 repeat protein
MTASPLSRRQFFGATAATAAIGALPASATEARPSPLAPEPLPPAGVCQRLGSARFRELEAPSQDATGRLQFSPDSKWLAQFEEDVYVGYEVATGRRVKWRLPEVNELGMSSWRLSNDTVFVRFGLDDLDSDKFSPRLYDRETGQRLKLTKFLHADHTGITPDGAGLIGCDEKELRRVNLRTGKVVWRRKWATDASVPAVTFTVTDRWVVGVGVQRLHLFDTATGNDGPRLEDAAPKDAPPDNHFTLVGFSADGKRVAGWHTAEVPNQAVVWDTTTGKVISRVNLPENAPPPVLTADGQHLLTTDATGRLVGYDVRSGKVTRHLAAADVADFQLSPDGKVLACFRSPQAGVLGGIDGLHNEPGGIVRLLNPATGELLPQSPDPAVELTKVRFADKHTVVAEANTGPSTSHLVWDTRTNRRRVFSPPQGQVHLPGLGGLAPVTFGALSPDGTRYVSRPEGNGNVIVTDAATGRRLHTLAIRFDFIDHDPFWIGRGCVGFVQPDWLTCWDLADHTSRAVSLKFATDGRVQNFVSTPDGRTVALLHWNDGNDRPTAPTVTWVDVKIGKLTTTRGEFGELSISADGGRVAVVAADERVRVTVIDRGGRRVTLGQPAGLNHLDPRIGLSPCGRTAFLTHARQDDPETLPVPVVQFWEALSGDLRAEYGTPFVAEGLGVSPCGRRVATTHRDAPVYLWDVFGEKSDPQAKPDASTWDALDGPTDKAFTAIRRLVQHPTAAVELLSAKLTPAEPPKAEWVKARIDKLGSTDFRTRHTAELELSAVADRIVEPLRKAIAVGAESPEADERLNRLIEKADGIPRSAWRAVRAVEALEYCDVPSAAVLLEKFAGGVDTAVLTREAKAAVKRRG